MSFAGHAQIEITHQAQFLVQVVVHQRRENGFAQAQRQRDEIRKGQAHFELTAMTFESSAQAKVPAAFDSRQVFVDVHAREQRNRGGVSDFTIEQRREAVTAGKSIKELVGGERLLGVAQHTPIGELDQGAASDHLFVLIFDFFKPILEEGIGISAA